MRWGTGVVLIFISFVPYQQVYKKSLITSVVYVVT